MNIKNLAIKLSSTLTSGEKRSLSKLIFLVALASLLELIGLSLVLPLIKIVTDLDSLLQNERFLSVYHFLLQPSENSIILFSIFPY